MRIRLICWFAFEQQFALHLTPLRTFSIRKDLGVLQSRGTPGALPTNAKFQQEEDSCHKQASEAEQTDSIAAKVVFKSAQDRRKEEAA